MGATVGGVVEATTGEVVEVTTGGEVRATFGVGVEATAGKLVEASVGEGEMAMPRTAVVVGATVKIDAAGMGVVKTAGSVVSGVGPGVSGTAVRDESVTAEQPQSMLSSPAVAVSVEEDSKLPEVLEEFEHARRISRISHGLK